jgi:predicted KAP-like P-loop ATPase
MWSDNETTQDFLNFGTVAKTVAEIVESASSRPISIGVSGAWGVGKSSLIKLIRAELDNSAGDASPFIFVEFNAWLYQGYDDARTALIEVVASALSKEAEERQTGVAKAVELMKRVDVFRVLKLTAGTAASLALGLPPTGLIAEAIEVGKGVLEGVADHDTFDESKQVIKEAEEKTKGLLRPKKIISPPKEIDALRRSFEETLAAMGVTLVVLIDDLDRCLPETTISTLEAIRLLLFLKHTAFVIAADDQMIKHAVKRHFQGVEDDLVTNYFDKLIQVPIRVPPLGTQEVRAYMMLLFIEDEKDLTAPEREILRIKVCEQLSKAWQGHRVDTKFFKEQYGKVLPAALATRLDLADRLAPLMTSAGGIAGNPRLIKRFLNALSIRMSMSRSQGVGVDESVLVKILLFERGGSAKAYADLVKAVTESGDGKPTFLSALEAAAAAGDDAQLTEPWGEKFLHEWLRLPPSLGDRDLRGALYVSREHAPLITAEDRLSSEAADLLVGLLDHPDMAHSIKDRLCKVSKAELSVIMDRVLVRAHQEDEWGAPPILNACLTLITVDQGLEGRLAAFLLGRPPQQIKANIVPKLGDGPWARPVLDSWAKDGAVSAPVKAAIRLRGKNGNVASK